MLDPRELLDAARGSLAGSSSGPPSDGQLRRAVSTAYYALFHTLLREGAQRFIGSARASSPAYGFLYRGYNHALMKRVCEDIDKDPLPKRYERLGYRRFSDEIRICARTFVELQQKRHEADYDPQMSKTFTEASDAIGDAELAITELAASSAAERDDFLALLLVGARD